MNPGDRIGRLQTTRVALSVVDIELDVVYEDEWVAAISKPPGLMTSGFAPRTAARALPGCLSPSSRPDALPAPWPAHRLDAPTGGLLLIAKTATAASALGKSFQNREVFKRYRALLTGRLDGEGEVTEALDERACHTRYRAVEHVRSLRYGWLTEVDMWPLTGRTHQLRRHMAGLGVPILGDRRYGSRGAIYRSKGLLLWAVELEVPHPDGTRRLHIEIPPPAKFATHQARETRRWLRHHPAPEDASASRRAPSVS